MSANYLLINGSGDRLLIKSAGTDKLRIDDQVFLAGTATAVSGGSGALNTDIQLAGTVVAVSGGSGSLARTRPLAGTAAALSGGSGHLEGPVRFQGVAQAFSAGVGSLAVTRGLAGTVQAVSGASAFLDVAIAPVANDETHYLRKWADHDITDVVTLIKVTTNWIENEHLSERYVKEMPE